MTERLVDEVQGRPVVLVFPGQGPSTIDLARAPELVRATLLDQQLASPDDHEVCLRAVPPTTQGRVAPWPGLCGAMAWTPHG
jgi:hypothetical protein